jgi:hypothetical protein
VIVAVPVFPPDAAVIVAVPGNSPVTTPDCDTAAVSGLSVDHVTGALATVAPFTSRTVAASVVVNATLTDAEEGVTITLPTGGAVTVTLTVPTFPSLVAVTFVVPAPTAVMSPVCETVATFAFPVCQVTGRWSGFPCPSRGVAVTCWVPPIVRLTVCGETPTVATGTAVTVTVAVPVLPSLAAVIVAVPGATAVTVPFATVATAGLLELHVTSRPVSTLFAASRVVGVNVPV